MTDAEKAANLAAHWAHHERAVANITPEQRREHVLGMGAVARASGSTSDYARTLIREADALIAQAVPGQPIPEDKAPEEPGTSTPSTPSPEAKP